MGLHNKIDSEISERISLVCRRLDNSVTPIQVLNWLNNFQLEEWNNAFSVLECLIYYSANRILSVLDNQLRKLLETHSSSRLLISEIGNYGKSSSAMIYYLRKTPTFKKYENDIKLLNPRIAYKKQKVTSNSTLVFVDDIIGSGESFLKHYKYTLVQQRLRPKVLILSIVCMENAFQFLEKEINDIEIFSDINKKAFSSRGSCFGYRPRMLPVRNFCYKYGFQLFQLYERASNRYIPYPLGFENTQSLVVFDHSAPNNTLPIIWSEKNNWYPLYPRTGRGKISRNKSFRDENWHWLSIGYNIGLFNQSFDKDSIYVKGMNFNLIGVIRLIKRGSALPTISQKLGLTGTELEEVINEGNNRGLIIDRNLTNKGEAYYDQILRKIRLSTRKYNSILKTNSIYVPKIFLGLS